MFLLLTWPPAKMTGEPEGLGLYGMVTPFGGDYRNGNSHCYVLTQHWQWHRKQYTSKSISHHTFTKSKSRFTNQQCLYLKHDNTDLLDTLDNGLWGPCNSDGTLCGIGQHVPCYLYLSSGWLQRHSHKQQKLGHDRCNTQVQDGLNKKVLIAG